MGLSDNLLQLPADVVSQLKPGQRLVKIGGRWMPVGVGGAAIPDSTGGTSAGNTEACWVCVVKDKADQDKLKLLKLDIESDGDITESINQQKLVPCPAYVTALKYGIETVNDTVEVEEFSLTFSGSGAVTLFNGGLPIPQPGTDIGVFENGEMLSVDSGFYSFDIGDSSVYPPEATERTIVIKYPSDWLTSERSSPKITILLTKGVFLYNHIATNEKGDEVRYIKLADNMPETIFDFSGSKIERLFNYMDSQGKPLPINLDAYSGASIATLPYEVSRDMAVGLDRMHIPEDVIVYKQDLAVFDYKILHNIDAETIVLRYNSLGIKDDFSGVWWHPRLKHIETSSDVYGESDRALAYFPSEANKTRSMRYLVRTEPLLGSFMSRIQAVKVYRNFSVSGDIPARFPESWGLADPDLSTWTVSDEVFDVTSVDDFKQLTTVSVWVPDLFKDYTMMTTWTPPFDPDYFRDFYNLRNAITQRNSSRDQTRPLYPIIRLDLNCAEMFSGCMWLEPTGYQLRSLFNQSLQTTHRPWWDCCIIDASDMFQRTKIREVDLDELFPTPVNIPQSANNYSELMDEYMQDSRFDGIFKDCANLHIIKLPRSWTRWPKHMRDWATNAGHMSGEECVLYKPSALPLEFNSEENGVTDRIPEGWTVIDY